VKIRLTHLYVFLIIILITASCRTFFVPGSERLNIRPNKLYEQIMQNELQYDNISVRFSAKISSETSSDSFKGNMRIKKDSIIWMSIRSLNIEGARIIITQDSLQFLNRIENSFFAGNVNFIADKYELEMSYDVIQSIFTNNFFFYPVTEDTIKTINNFKQCSDPELYCMSSLSERKYYKFYVDSVRTNRWERRLEREIKDSTSQTESSPHYYNEFVIQIVKVYPEIYRISEVYLENHIQQQSLNIKYGRLFKTEEQYFPENIKLDLVSSQIKIKLEISIDNVSFNKENLSFPFSIPDKYEEIKIL
jgi:hypothetical protein